MKLIKSANGKTKLTISKNEWLTMGKKEGWVQKQAQSERDKKINEFADRILGPEEMNDVMKEIPKGMKDDVLQELRHRRTGDREDYRDERGEVPGEQDTGPHEYEEASSNNKKIEAKEWDPNPWAVCTESIGKTEGTTERSEWSEDAKKRYEECVQEVKKQQASSNRKHIKANKDAKIKFIRTANGIKVKMNKNEWKNIGKKQGWLGKKAKEEGWPEDVEEGKFTKWCKNHGFEEGAGIGCVREAYSKNEDGSSKYDSEVRGMASFYANTVKPEGKDLGEILDNED